MADMESNQTHGPTKVIHLPVPAKGKHKHLPEAYKSVVLAWDKREKQAAAQEAERLARILEDLAKQVRNREVHGFWFLADLGQGNHEFGIEGTYNKAPAKAYFPSCRALYYLSELVQKNGGI